MDFEKLFDDLKDNIESALKVEVDLINSIKTDYVVPYINKILYGYPDTTKITYNTTLFILPNEEYNVERIGANLNEITIPLSIYIIAKGASEQNLETIILRYMEAFFNLVDKNNDLNNLFDIWYITNLKKYDDVEGLQNTKAVEINLNIIKEV